MLKIALSRSTFELLMEHVKKIEEEKDKIIEEHYPNLTEDRDHFNQLMSNYIKEVKNYISKAEIMDAIDVDCPFVIIGSIVEVEDLAYNEVEKFQVVSPFISKQNSNWDYASYLSPLGKALLLKKVNDKVEIETPAGKSSYRIKSIRLPEESASNIA